MWWFFAVCSAVRYSIFSVLLFWYHSMRATMVIVSMLTACPALVESGMPHYMVAAPGRPTLHDGGSITGSRFTIWLCSCAGYSTALLLLAFGWQHRLWSAYVADLCCPGGRQPHGRHDRPQRLYGRHDWPRVQRHDRLHPASMRFCTCPTGGRGRWIDVHNCCPVGRQPLDCGPCLRCQLPWFVHGSSTN